MNNENSAHSFTEGSDSGTLKFSNPAVKEETKHTPEINLNDIVITSDSKLGVVTGLGRYVGEVAVTFHDGRIKDFESKKLTPANDLLKENQELKARIEELENEIKVLQQFDER